MKRREFIAGLGSATAWPMAGRAQQSVSTRRIAVLMGFPESDAQAQAYIAAFRDELQKLGWADGRNVRIDTRWATHADPDAMRQFAKELVALQPDLILSNTTPTTAALLRETRRSPLPPYAERDKDPEYHHYYGKALSLIVTAEAALIRQGEEYMDCVRADAEGRAEFDLALEQRLSLIGLQAINLAWEALELIFRTAGTTASVKHGQPIGRFFRNIAAIRTHPILQLERGMMGAARTRLGV